MAQHIRTEKGDGNGTPAGIRISYSALMALLGLLGIVWTVAYAVRSEDMKQIARQFDSARAETTRIDTAREKDKAELMVELRRLGEKIDRLAESK